MVEERLELKGVQRNRWMCTSKCKKGCMSSVQRHVIAGLDSSQLDSHTEQPFCFISVIKLYIAFILATCCSWGRGREYYAIVKLLAYWISMLNIVKSPKFEMNIYKILPASHKARLVSTLYWMLCWQCYPYVLMMTWDCWHIPANGRPLRSLHCLGCSTCIFCIRFGLICVEMYLKSFHFEERTRKRSKILPLLFTYCSRGAASRNGSIRTEKAHWERELL